MPDETRSIQMTEAQRDYLDTLPSNDTLYAIVAAWDEAGEPKKPSLYVTREEMAAIYACPTPTYHKTHRYCPSCPWTEDANLRGCPSYYGEPGMEGPIDCEVLGCPRCGYPPEVSERPANTGDHQ